MFNTPPIVKGLSFAKIVGGLSRTLQIANQIIPLYQRAKPAIKNARYMLGMLKEISKSSSDSPTSEKSHPSIEKEKQIPKEKSADMPTFFL